MIDRPLRQAQGKLLDFSIIIVSFNVRDLLRACLRSIDATLAGGALTYETIVVDNASADGSAEMARSEFPAVKLIARDDNPGFAAANNIGLRQAKGRLLLFLNPDTEVRPEAISRLAAFLDTNPRAGVVTGKLLYGDGSFQHGAFAFPTLWMSFLDFFPLNHRLTNSRLNGRYPLSAYAAPFRVGHPLGACMMARRELVEQVGPWSEDYFMYCEEIDWCLRIRRAGWELWCEPRAEVVHHAGQSTRQFREAMFVELHRSRFKLFRRHYPLWFQVAHRAIVCLGVSRELARIALASKGSIDGQDGDAKRRAYREVLSMAVRGG